jgi:hypothetical protein
LIAHRDQRSIAVTPDGQAQLASLGHGLHAVQNNVE